MATLTLAGDTIELGGRLVWTDEFAWSPVLQSVEYSTTGALIVDVGERQAGRPITLDGTETQAWFPREVCDQLLAWVAVPGAELTLVLRGEERTVIFDQARGGFEARPLWDLADGEESADQLLRVTLRFLET